LLNLVNLKSRPLCNTSFPSLPDLCTLNVCG
jgi:hypothetical protein